MPHDYVELEALHSARFVRVTNAAQTPGTTMFSLMGVRVFGNAGTMKPAVVTGTVVARNASDARRATVSWQPAEGAEYYIVRYGVQAGGTTATAAATATREHATSATGEPADAAGLPGEMFHNYQVSATLMNCMALALIAVAKASSSKFGVKQPFVSQP